MPPSLFLTSHSANPPSMPLPVTPSQVDHDVSEPNIAVGVRITSCTPQDGAMEIEKLRARLDEANAQLIAGVVESLIRETEVVAANAEMLLEAGTQVLQAQRAAEVAEAVAPVAADIIKRS